MVALFLASTDAFPDTGDLLGVDEVIEGGKIITALRTGGEEEVFCNVEEGGCTRAFLVATGLDEEVSIYEGADHGIRVHTTGSVDIGAGDGTQVENAGEDLVSRARERGRASLLAEPLDGGGAERVRRELKSPGDFPEYDPGG